jgi:hypothetical protein
MLDNASVTPANDLAVIDEISLCVYQVILEIQQQQPEFLKEKYRSIPWNESRNRDAFLRKLRAGISKAQQREALIGKVQKFLQMLLISSYFELPSIATLMSQIGSLTQQLQESSNSTDLNASQPAESASLPTSTALTPLSPGIAILLLDAENLQLDTNTEKFLAGVCSYPIQIKVAFANWRNMGKHDIEFHGRGYELIHVPAGKDSADVKMATVGSSIFVHYPTAKEVLVCSSDGVLTHLCTTLQTHGLTVYLVRKQGENLTVLNSKTSQAKTYSLKSVQEIPSLEDFLVQLVELIKAEQKRTKNQWVKLERISRLFQEKYQLLLSQVVSHHLPSQKVRDFFIEHPAHFVVHQISAQSELYINLFKPSSTNFTQVNQSQQQAEPKAKAKSTVEISSRTELEQILSRMIEAATNQSPGSYMPITILGTQFQRKYSQSVTIILKKLQLNAKFSKFLQSCKTFELKLTDKGWEVAVRKILGEDS